MKPAAKILSNSLTFIVFSTKIHPSFSNLKVPFKNSVADETPVAATTKSQGIFSPFFKIIAVHFPSPLNIY